LALRSCNDRPADLGTHQQVPGENEQGQAGENAQKCAVMQRSYDRRLESRTSYQANPAIIVWPWA
jgi:hypothetical protein